MRIRRLVWIGMVACVAWPTLARSADDSADELRAIRQELEALHASQSALREELRQIRSLLQRQPVVAAPAAIASPTLVDLALEGAQIRGSPHAKVVLVEYSDFHCPFCARYATTTYREIARDYVDTGRMRYAFMSLPLESLHPSAFAVHVAAACAGDQGRFWELHDRLFGAGKPAEPNALHEHAAAIGLDASAFATCVERQPHAAAIRSSIARAGSLGIAGTPTFVIGVAGPDETVKVVKSISGAKPYAVFREAIEEVLATTVATTETVAPSRPAIQRSARSSIP